ncbi:MAG: NADPH-dependent FMN reductase [Microbacteriaceae bacterium]
MSNIRIGYVIGSLAKNSINRQLANAMVKLAPENVEMVELEIKDLPLYSHDYDADYPAVANEFKDSVSSVDGVLFITPEFNRGIPAALKNAIEWGSRPWGQNVWGKPAATLGASGGGIGTAVAQQHLRAILLHLGATVMGQPEGYIQLTEGLIDDNHNVTSPETEKFFQFWIQSFSDFVAQHAAVKEEVGA